MAPESDSTPIQMEEARRRPSADQILESKTPPVRGRRPPRSLPYSGHLEI